MANFNVDASVDVQNLTGASRGFTSGKEAFAGLFKDVGNLGMAAVQIADQHNIQTQTQMADEGVSSILNDFGFRTEGNETTGTPKELQGYAKQLTNTQKAFNSGALKESNFQIRIDALSRKMRSQFPGYNNEIDTLISKALNRSTANDLRKTLSAEWEAAQEGANADDKSFRSEITQARKDGALYSVFPEYDKLVAEGKEPSKYEVRYRLGQYYGEVEKAAQGKRQLDYLETQNKATEKKRMDIAYEDVSQVSNQIIKTGTSGTDFQRIMKNITSKQAKDWTDVELQEVTGAYAQLEASAKVQVLERLNDPVYSKLTKTQRDELVSRALEPLSILKDAITAKDVGLINVFKTITDTQTSKDVSEFLTMSGEKGDLMSTVGRKLAVARTVFGPEAAQLLVMKEQDAIGTALSSLMNSELAVGTPLKEIVKAGGDVVDPAVKGTVVKEMVETSVRLLVDPNVPQAGKEKVIESLFGSGNAGFLEKFSEKVNSKSGRSDRMIMFEKLMSPEVTASVLAAGKTNPEVIDKYKNTMGAAFSGLFKSDIDNVVSVSQFSDYMKFVYNPNSMQFEAVSKKNPSTVFATGALPLDVTGVFYNLNEQWKISSAKKSLDNLNKYIKILDPAMKGVGVDTSEALIELFTATGVIGGGKPPGSLFTQLGEALSSVSLNGGDAMGKALQEENKSNENIFGNPQEDSRKYLRDFIGKAEGADYNTLNGGRKAPLTGMSVGEAIEMAKYNRAKSGGKYTTAVGKYQIIEETLRRAMDGAGISEDDIFDANTQDTLANWLIDNEAGGGKDAASLAKVWASLPFDETNQSVYQGDKQGNKATVSYKDLQKVLQK